MSQLPDIKGWCPGAWRPMQSGDGLILRIRPFGGRLSAAQLAGIADLSMRHGNGVLNLTARANLQMRGLSESGHMDLLNALDDLGLLDDDPAAESRRNIVLSPFAKDQGLASRLAAGLEGMIKDPALEGLPGKFGYVVEEEGALRLHDISGDIRLAVTGPDTVLLWLDGMSGGMPVKSGNAIQMVRDLCLWFLQSGGVVNGRGRMKRFLTKSPDLPAWFQPDQVLPDHQQARPLPGPSGQDLLVAFPFGRVEASALRQLSEMVSMVKITPWNMIKLNNISNLSKKINVILSPDDNRLRMAVCSGAPGCGQGLQATLPLADRLVNDLPPGQDLHISGCAKGCAGQHRRLPTIVATADGYDFAPHFSGYSADEVVAHFQASKRP